MKQNWIDLCDDEDEYDQSGQEQNDKIDDSQHPIINLPSKETKEQNLSLDNLSPQGIEDNNKSDQVKKKFLYQSQPANEMLEQLEELPDGNEYFINLFNVDSKATVDIIKQYFCDIKILNVFANPNKIGNYDLIIENKEEVRKFIEKGAGAIEISKSNKIQAKKALILKKRVQPVKKRSNLSVIKTTTNNYHQFTLKKLKVNLINLRIKNYKRVQLHKTKQKAFFVDFKQFYCQNELKFGMNSQRQYQKQYEELKELPVLKPKMYSERKPKVRKDKGRKIVYQYKKEGEFDEMLVAYYIIIYLKNIVKKTNSNLMEEENNNLKKQTHYKSLNDFSSNTEHKYYQKRKDGMKKHMEIEYVPKQSLEETKEIQMKSLQNQDIIKIEVDEQKCFSQELEKPEEYQQQQQEEEFVQKVNEEKQLQCQQEEVESLNKSLDTKEKSKEQIMQDKLEKKKQKNKMKTKNKRKKQKQLKEQQLQKEEAILKEKKEKEKKIKEEEEKASQKVKLIRVQQCCQVSLNQNLKTEERSYFSFFRCYI